MFYFDWRNQIVLTVLTEHKLISEGRRHVQLENDGFSISLRAQIFFCLILSRFRFFSPSDLWWSCSSLWMIYSFWCLCRFLSSCFLFSVSILGHSAEYTICRSRHSVIIPPQTHLPPPMSQKGSAENSTFHQSAARTKHTPGGCSCPWCLLEGVWRERSRASAADTVRVSPEEVSPASPCPAAVGQFWFVCVLAFLAPSAAPASAPHHSTTQICQDRGRKRSLVFSFFFRDTTNKKWRLRPGGSQQR